MSRPAISVLLPTFNCAGIVRATLESVRWADEILVADSFSTDGTLEICREYGARIVQHEYLNSARQKNWAAPQCKHEWVLQIDSDEVVSGDLRQEIEQTLAAAPPDLDACRIPRKNEVLGRWVRHGGIYPDYQTRLFRRDRGRWKEREVHAHLEVPGRLENLRNPLLHFGMPHISKQVRNLDRYTRYEADELRKNGKRFRLIDLVAKPPGVFLHRYIWQQGFRDGLRGLVLAGYQAAYEFLSYAKLWELEELGLERSPK
jgi:glycosyltransferase involved in cell wall biosynthesis